MNPMIIIPADTYSTLRESKKQEHVKTLICETYIVEEITFISYYFEPHLRTRINRVPRNDDRGEMPLSENLLLFSHPRRLVQKKYNEGKILDINWI